MLGRRKKGETVENMACALDVLDSRVMMADADFNITYMNATMLALMAEAESEIRQELPQFRAASLLGANIDVFHKNPGHQRGMLAALTKPHRATIRVGVRAFDLLVTPLSHKGQRTGFVVEWVDARARLQNLDYTEQLAAVGTAFATIEFSPDGLILDANPIFLDTFGYRIDELRGKHHRVLVDEAARASNDYAAFWDDLRRGVKRSGQFRRLDKTGREVWLEGAYAPSHDAGGHVVKVLKVASNVTAQVKVLDELKTLIDVNFGEIDGAVGLSTTEAGSAAVAADETSTVVHAMAASAEQLAASIGQISRNMHSSRTATESAFRQVVSVGQNTDTLAAAAQAMNGIVSLIRTVASQINLLALNATIEAARAGDAGKGFAVVASEVKGLAVQTAKATEQISHEIDGIQSTSATVAAALSEIRDAVNIVQESVTLTAAAVEEQSAVTAGMSANMQTVFQSVSTIIGNIGQISSSVERVGETVAKTKRAAQVLVR